MDYDIDFTQFDEDGFCNCYEEVGDEDLQDEGFDSVDPEDGHELTDRLNEQLKEHNVIILSTFFDGDPGMGIMYMAVPLDEFKKKRAGG